MKSIVFVMACQIFAIQELLAKGLAGDGELSFKQLAYKYGHKPREYNILTDDGYMLKLFRIPGRKGLPVLLMHGILDSSDTWIIRGNASLAIALASQGYDVWAGNCRGNRYSRSHLYLDPDTSDQFWDFSFHDYGYYDLAAIVDAVLLQTGAHKLNAIAHSQGNTIFYVLGSTRPEYNEKVNLLIGLAPVAYLHHALPPLSTLITYAPELNTILKKNHINEILGDSSLLTAAVRALYMHRVIFTLSGTDAEEVEPEFVRVMIGHYPTGTSRKNLYHYAQVGSSKRFARYDYGRNGNFEKYHTKSPPEYDLGSVTMSVALFVGANDRVATIEDVELLSQRLPNVVKHLIVPRKKMNHIDFVVGRNMKDYLFPYIFEVLKRYDYNLT